MTTLQLKYEKLDPAAQKEAEDFIDFLLTKKEKDTVDRTEHKKDLLKVSVWSDEDIKPTEEAAKHFNWKVEEW